MGACCGCMAGELAEERLATSGPSSRRATITRNEKSPTLRKPAWKSDSPLTKEQLTKMRQEFWETAPTYGGRKHIWDALKAACETADMELAHAIIISANIAVPSGELTEAFDELGEKYTIPLYCIRDPDNLDTGAGSAGRQESLNAAVGPSKAGNLLHLKVRLSTPKDVHIDVPDTSTALDLKVALFEKEGLKVPLQRMFVTGQLLDDKVRLRDVPLIRDGAVIQVLMKTE